MIYAIRNMVQLGIVITCFEIVFALIPIKEHEWVEMPDYSPLLLESKVFSFNRKKDSPQFLQAVN